MLKNKRRLLLNLVFLIIVFSLTLWAVFRGQDLQAVLDGLRQADLRYVMAGLVCVLLFILGEAVILRHLLYALGVRVRFSHCCLYSFIGFFYSSITPSASGGQPMQMVAMRKDGICLAESTVTLAIVAITYKLVLVVFALAVLCIRPAGIIEYLDPVRPLLYLGIALNVVCIAAMVILVFWQGLARRLTLILVRLWGKIRPYKNPDAVNHRFLLIFQKYEKTAGFFANHQKLILKVLMITVVQRFLLFFITWLTYRGFALQGHSAVTVVTLQGMIAAAADILPLPGGMGVSETMFLDVFRPIFGEAYILPGMMISRGISFYAQLAMGAVMTALSGLFIREKREEQTE